MALTMSWKESGDGCQSAPKCYVRDVVDAMTTTDASGHVSGLLLDTQGTTHANILPDTVPGFLFCTSGYSALCLLRLPTQPTYNGATAHNIPDD
jgi:hypothetical protein